MKTDAERSAVVFQMMRLQRTLLEQGHTVAARKTGTMLDTMQQPRVNWSIFLVS